MTDPVQEARALLAEVTRASLTKYLIRSPILLKRLVSECERLKADYAEIVEHHRQCELAGTRLAELVKREVIGGPSPHPDDTELRVAVEEWDAHQWPSLHPEEATDG